MLKFASPALAYAAPAATTTTGAAAAGRRLLRPSAAPFGSAPLRGCASRYHSSVPTKREPPTRRDTHLQHSLGDGTLRRRLRAREPIVGAVTSLCGDTSHVETLGLLGYDFLWVDAEHTPASPDSVASLILAAERRGMPALVQTGRGYGDVIGHAQKYLVAGAQGIISPRCESGDDVRRTVEGVKFPPLGRRGLAGERWNGWCLGEGGAMSDRVEACNENSVVGVVVESRRGIDAIDEVLGADGLDFVYLNPLELSCDLGVPGQVDHHDVMRLVDDAGDRIRAAGISAGIAASTPGEYGTWRNLGFNVICASAHGMFVAGARGMMDAVVGYEGGTAAYRVAGIADSDEESESESVEERPPPPPIPAPVADPIPDLSDVRCLKAATMKVLASTMESHEVASMREVFNLIDTNGDGDLQLDELEDVIEDGGFNATTLEKLESIRDGMIESGLDHIRWEDYLMRSMNEDVVLREDNIRRAYDHLRRAAGGMSVSSLVAAFGSEEVARRVLNVIDTSGDGEISYEEFRDAVNRLAGIDPSNRCEGEGKVEGEGGEAGASKNSAGW